MHWYNEYQEGEGDILLPSVVPLSGGYRFPDQQPLPGSCGPGLYGNHLLHPLLDIWLFLPRQFVWQCVFNCCHYNWKIQGFFCPSIINILKFYSVKAVCLAHKYNYRNARIGHRRLVLRYVCPVLVLAIILNIPKVIVISPFGDILKNNHSLWHLVVLYQVHTDSGRDP